MYKIIKRGAMCLAAFAVITFCIIMAVSYYTVCQFAYCRPYSQKQQASIAYRQSQLWAQGAQEIRLVTDDGITLSAFLLLRKQARRVVLLCHGYRMSKESMTRIANMLPNDSLLMFDFRGHGNSTGNVISIGCHEVTDIFAALDFLEHDPKTAHLPRAGIGVSMGGASLLRAAAQGAHFDALIIDSSFSRLYDQIIHRFKASTGLSPFPFAHPTLWLFEHTACCVTQDINPVDAIQHITCPILIIHSLDDEFTPVNQAEQLYQAAHNPKELWLVPTAAHGLIAKNYAKEYTNRITNFLHTYC